MRRFRLAAAALVLGTTLSGCWMQPGYDVGRSNWNPNETAITAANADQLTEVWSYSTGGPVFELLSSGGDVFALSESPTGVGVSLDLATGAHQWTYSRQVGSILYGLGLSNPVYVDGRIEAAWNNITIRPFNVFPGGRVVIDAATGEELEFSSGADAVVTQLAVNVTLARGLLHVAPRQVDWLCDAVLEAGGPEFAFVGLGLAWSAGSVAHGYRDCDPGTGQWASTWTTELGGTPTEVAAVGTDAAAYLDSGGTVSVLDATTGAIRWTAALGAGSGGLMVADGKIIVRDFAGGRLVAYAADTGAPVWEAPFTSDVAYSPAAGGDVVYLPVRSLTTNESAVIAYDLHDGTQLANLPVGPRSILADPIITGGRVLVGTDDGTIVAFGLPN